MRIAILWIASVLGAGSIGFAGAAVLSGAKVQKLKDALAEALERRKEREG